MVSTSESDIVKSIISTGADDEGPALGDAGVRVDDRVRTGLTARGVGVVGGLPSGRWLALAAARLERLLLLDAGVGVAGGEKSGERVSSLFRRGVSDSVGRPS